MAVRTFDPKKVVIVVNAVPIRGFADGTFITVERNSDNYNIVSGADGQVSRSKINDRTGVITLSLTQTSPSNTHLSLLAVLDERTGSGVVPVGATDLLGKSTVFSAVAWVRKLANLEYSKGEISTVEWNLDCTELNFFHNGNAITGE